MNQDALKRAAGEAALTYLPESGVIGVGTGSTVNAFIDCLAPIADRFEAAVASSAATAERLRAIGMQLEDLNSVRDLGVYVDGADEATRSRHLVKGGGGALTREKICAAVAERFVCIVDESKVVGHLGKFPLPVEVIPMARSHVARELAKLGGQPELRTGFTTDNGNVILDVHHLDLVDAAAMETRVNQIVGVVANGLFCHRPADTLLVASPSGIESI